MPPKKGAKKPYYGKKKGAKKSTPATFEKQVLSVIHKQAEDKMVSFNHPLTAYNSSITLNTDMSRIIGPINPGTATDQRVGEEIRLKSVNIKGHLIMSSTSYTSANTRLGVRVMILSSKRYPHLGDAIANYLTTLPVIVKNGTDENPFDGSIQSLYSEVNTQQFTKHYDKVFYMTQPLRTVTTAIGITETPISQFSTRFFNINLKCKNRKITFKDGANYGYGFEPFMVLGYVHLDGSVADTVETQVSAAYTATCKYEDM